MLRFNINNRTRSRSTKANSMSDEKLPHNDGDKDIAERVIQTRDLFDGQREICIDHEGTRYRLRITRRNKLILQK
jgi:hemin uptake protein HemP